MTCCRRQRQSCLTCSLTNTLSFSPLTCLSSWTHLVEVKKLLLLLYSFWGNFLLVFHKFQHRAGGQGRCSDSLGISPWTVRMKEDSKLGIRTTHTPDHHERQNNTDRKVFARHLSCVDTAELGSESFKWYSGTFHVNRVIVRIFSLEVGKHNFCEIS